MIDPLTSEKPASAGFFMSVARILVAQALSFRQIALPGLP
jgi:hypothetical protein